MKWEPIETAPKDGTWILGTTKTTWMRAIDMFSYPLKYRFHNGDWYADDGRTYDPRPTHWRLLKTNLRSVHRSSKPTQRNTNGT